MTHKVPDNKVESSNCKTNLSHQLAIQT